MFGRKSKPSNKVLPTQDSSVSVHVNRVVHDIEDELSELAKQTENEMRQLRLGNDDDFDRLSKQRDDHAIYIDSPSAQSLPAPVVSANSRNTMNSRSQPSGIVAANNPHQSRASASVSKPADDEQVDQLLDVDSTSGSQKHDARSVPLSQSSGKEDVKLSHELDNGSLVVAAEIEDQVAKLKKQIEEYRQRYVSAAEKLREAESKIADLIIKGEELEDENKKLTAENKEASMLNKNTAKRVRGAGLSPDEELHKRSEQIRKALLADDNADELEVALIANADSIPFAKLVLGWLSHLLPFKKDIRNIQARFGTSVASYFVFHRLVYLQFFPLVLFYAVLLVAHLAFLISRGSSISSIFSSPGYLPKLMLLSSFKTEERLYYSIMVLAPIIYLMVLLCVQLVSNHRNALTFQAVQTENEIPMSREVLAAWDFSTTVKIEIDDNSGRLGNTFLHLLEDVHSQGLKKMRSRFQLFVLYLRRALGLFLYLLLMAASVSAIVYITINSTNISARAQRLPGLGYVGSLAAPFALSMINSAMPILLSFITLVEKWDSAQTELNFLLLRVFISSTLNSIILAFSYLLLIDPFLFAEYSQLRRSIQLEVDERFSCRYDQAADGIFSLLGISWAINNIGLLGSPIAMRLLAYFRGVPWTKPEFQVAQSMVKKFSFLGLVFVSLPIVPLAGIFVPVFLFIGFKWEKYIIKHYYSKPKRPFQGQKAALIFSFFYLVTYILLGLSVAGYIFTTKTMPKSCSIQDDYVRLCIDEVGDAGKDKCTLDEKSRYFTTFDDDDYPKAICKDACGPFVNQRSMTEPLKDTVTRNAVVDVIWSIAFRYPYVPWAVIVVMSILLVMRGNINQVAKLSAFYKARAMEAQIQTIEGERKKQEKIIQKLKSIEYDEEGYKEVTVDDGAFMSPKPKDESINF